MPSVGYKVSDTFSLGLSVAYSDFSIDSYTLRFFDGNPLNEQRLAMLDTFEAALADRLTCEHVLVAMFLPAVRIYRSDAPFADRYLHFLGRAYTDPSPVVRDFINTHYIQILGRFFSAFQQTLPELERHDLGFRLNFAMGALASILAAGNTQRVIREFTQGSGDNEALILSRLASLMVAALKALSEEGSVPATAVAQAIQRYGINPDKINPLFA